MIVIATLKDEMVDGQRRASGRKIRKMVAICVDSFNLVLAEGSDPEKLVGQKFVHNLVLLARIIEEYGLDVEYARRQMIAFFQDFCGDPVGDLSWSEMDARFKVSKRRTDASGILVLHDQLKGKGRRDKET